MAPSAITSPENKFETLTLDSKPGNTNGHHQAGGEQDDLDLDLDLGDPFPGHSRQLIDPRTRFSDEFLTFPPPADVILQRSFETPPDCGERSYVGRGRLLGRHALITGGDSGIGRAVAIAYAREGAKVAINYLPEEELDAQDVAKVLAREGLTIVRIPGDLRDEKFCGELVKQAHHRLGGLDIVVSNAGWVRVGSLSTKLSQLSIADFDRTFRTNVYAPFFITRAAVKYLPPGAALIYTCSIAEDLPEFLTDYSATKAALTNMVGSLAIEFGPSGFRVNGVDPGVTFTPMLARVENATEVIRTFASRVPLRRMQQPVEIAPVYVNLADDKLSYATGGIWGSHGGFSGAF